MKTILRCLTLCLLAIAVRADETGALELFNGRDLSGWKAYSSKEGVSQADVWSVRDGVIVCRGEPIGWLATERVFTNFTLSVEWRWAPGQEPGNSGVFLRLHGEPRALPHCYEVQLKNGSAGDLFGFHGLPSAVEDAARRLEIKGHELGGDLAGAKRAAGTEQPVGEWNRADITVQGGEIAVSINGQPANRLTGCAVTGGSIALQSEGGEVHFRKVRLTPRP